MPTGKKKRKRKNGLLRLPIISNESIVQQLHTDDLETAKIDSNTQETSMSITSGGNHTKSSKKRSEKKKGKIGCTATVYRKFSAPPKPEPLSICFQTHDNTLNHHIVLALIKNKLKVATDTNIVSVRYENRNAMYGTFHKADRWIVTVDNERAKRELLGGIERNGQLFLVRPYDDVMNEDYNTFLKYQKLFMKQL